MISMAYDGTFPRANPESAFGHDANANANANQLPLHRQKKKIEARGSNDRIKGPMRAPAFESRKALFQLIIKVQSIEEFNSWHENRT
jgi:hypothetical protein